jgi:hypothetical protein
MTQSGHRVGNEQEAIAYYRNAFEIDSALETARDKFWAQRLSASLLIGRMRVYDLDSMRLHQLVDLRVDVQAPRNC